jgi:hypothetical protein
VDDWSVLTVGGPLGVLFAVLTTLVLRLASHLSNDRANQLSQIAQLRERHAAALDAKDATIARFIKELEEQRERAWKAEDAAAKWRRQAERNENT